MKNKNYQDMKQNNSQEEFINVREFFGILLKHKFFILIVTIVFAILSVFIALSLPNIYKSEAQVAPSSESSSSGLSALAGQFGGLASMAGINLGGSDSGNKTLVALEILQSRKFISEFIINHDILPELMAAKSWEQKTGKLAFDQDIYDEVNKKWVRDVDPPLKPEPSLQEATLAFREKLGVFQNSETGMVFISVEHISPQIAQHWVSLLISDINEVMRQRDVTEAKRSTEYLTEQLKKTEIADIQSILFKMIEEQAKVIMLAEVREEYVFKTIDPAIIPELKFKPKRALVCLLITFLGGVLSVLIVLVRYFTRT